jgi:Sec-independent protein translocase protein TatA
VPDNESNAKIDTAAISEAIKQFRQRLKDLNAEVERINAARKERGAAESDTAGIPEAVEAARQLIKDLDAAIQRIPGARRYLRR